MIPRPVLATGTDVDGHRCLKPNGRIAMQERRQASRFNSSLYVIWDLTAQSVASGQTANFSATGCFIHSRNGLPTKPRLSIRFRLPTERWMEIQGKVVHTGWADGFGVSFTELSNEDRAMLGLLEEYEQAGSGSGTLVKSSAGIED